MRSAQLVIKNDADQKVLTVRHCGAGDVVFVKVHTKNLDDDGEFESCAEEFELLAAFARTCNE